VALLLEEALPFPEPAEAAAVNRAYTSA
jgi:hypothetical protein